jgi:hypothetical protein
VKRNLCIALFVLNTSILLAQADFNTLGIGFQYGFRGAYSSAGSFIEYRLNKYFNLNTGCGLNRYEGDGVGGGFRVFPIGYNRISPVASFNYIAMSGANFAIEDNNGLNEYRIYPRQFFVTSLGLNIGNKNASLYVSGSYRFYPRQPPEFTFVSGNYSPAVANDIRKFTGEGFGVSVSFILYIILNRSYSVKGQ